MTTPNQQAIEAATREHINHTPVENRTLGQYRYEITCSCGHMYQVDGHSAERQESFLDHVYKIALTAALPALEQQIREQVAEEIRAYLDGFNSHGLPYRDGVYAGINSAARIAEGKEQK